MKKITEKSLITIKNNRSSCPVSTSLEIVGDQWSLILIRDLFMQRNTFSDFKNSPEKISTNILSDRINKLLKYKLIDYAISSKPILNINNGNKAENKDLVNKFLQADYSGQLIVENLDKYHISNVVDQFEKLF